MDGTAQPLAAPALETERLVLRPHGKDDFADCAAMWADPAVVTFIGDGRPFGPEEVWSRLLRYIGHWALMGYGYWAVRDKADGRFVGDVGFMNLRRGIEPGLGEAPEIGWVLASSAHGRGFAAEAVGAALRWGDRFLASPETVCIIRPDHRRSIRVAERAGFGFRAEGRYHSTPMAIFARPRVFLSSDPDTTS